MLGITLVFTWMNHWFGDFYLISLPFSVVTFAVIAIILSQSGNYEDRFQEAKAHGYFEHDQYVKPFYKMIKS